MQKKREKNWRAKEKDYVAALVQLQKQDGPCRKINGLWIKDAIQKALEKCQ